MEPASAVSFNGPNNTIAPWCVPACLVSGIPIAGRVFRDGYAADLPGISAFTGPFAPQGAFLYFNIQTLTNTCDLDDVGGDDTGRQFPENMDGAYQAFATSNSFNLTYAPLGLTENVPTAIAWARANCTGVEADLDRDAMLYFVPVDPGFIGFG